MNASLLCSDSQLLEETAGFCLNRNCKAPLRATSDWNHWDERVKDVLRSIHTSVQEVFPDSSLPLDFAVVPCGRDCTSFGFTAEQEHTSQIVLTTFSSISVAGILFSVVVFFYNWQELGRMAVRRMLLMFTITGGLGMIPYMFAARGNMDYLCHSDRTLITHAPGCGSNAICGYLAWHAQFFATMAVGYVVSLMYSWQKLCRLLSTPCTKLSFLDNSMTTWWSKYRADVASFILAFVPAFCLSMAAVGQHGYEGAPIFGVCALSVERRFAGYYNWYHVVALGPSMCFLAHGMHILVKQYGVFGTLRWIKGDDISQARVSPGSSKADRRSLESLKKFSRHLLIYLLIAIASFFGYLSFAVNVEVGIEKWKEEEMRHIQCTITSCSPELCPPPLKLSAVTFIGRLAISFVGVFFLSTWLYSLSYVANVPGIGKLVKQVCGSCRRRLVSNSSTSQLNSSISSSVNSILSNTLAPGAAKT